MSYLSVAYDCNSCGGQFEDLVKRSARDEGVQCKYCSAQLGRDRELLEPPKVLRASWPMGRRTDTAKELIEAAKLEADAFNKRPKERKEQLKEVKKLRTPSSLRKSNGSKAK